MVMDDAFFGARLALLFASVFAVLRYWNKPHSETRDFKLAISACFIIAFLPATLAGVWTRLGDDVVSLWLSITSFAAVVGLTLALAYDHARYTRLAPWVVYAGYTTIALSGAFLAAVQ